MDDLTDQERLDLDNECFPGNKFDEKLAKDTPLDEIISKYSKPPKIKRMNEIHNKNDSFMIQPFEYDRNVPDTKPKPVNYGSSYTDRCDGLHLVMPCSPAYMSVDHKLLWPSIYGWITHLKTKCEKGDADYGDLKATIDACSGVKRNMDSLNKLATELYSDDDFKQFMSKTLSKMCELVLGLDKIWTEPPPLLPRKTNCSVTMSQRQAACLLACSFFCLFPPRNHAKGYENYQHINFDGLFEAGPLTKIEKLKCILHYFHRITEKMPTGVITFQRSILEKKNFPQWPSIDEPLSDLYLTTDKRIEDIPNTLQVDFANEYIGGGVLGGGCVQEEIRFVICPEMLVSLLLCEKMEKNECIYLIGCERFSSYKGYANTFQFDGDYRDETPKDHWGRKWCHLVAMDAVYFNDPSTQYHPKEIERELLKAYTSFLPQDAYEDSYFAIATGNWGCGAFNGDRQLKAIIQLMAASAARRPIIYAAFGDKKLVASFAYIYEELKTHQVKVADLFYMLPLKIVSSSSCPLGLTPVGANHFMGSDFSIPVDLGP
ncbi:unnamed protein product, partial [Adineta ricciae]